MTTVAARASAAPPRYPRSRGLAAARIASQLYLYIVVFLCLAALLPMAVGWQPRAVISGSMEPAVATGSAIVTAPLEEDQALAYPSIISFEDASGATVTHRVVETDSTGDTPVYTTKGDANDVADSTPVAQDQVLGAARMVVPFVGLPAAWLTNGQHAWLLGWLALTVLTAAIGLRRDPQ